MPRVKSGKTSSDGTTKTTDDTKPEKVQLGDSGGLKRRLDDAVAQVVTDSGYLEDHTYSNIKLCLGALTIGVALLAQFYPLKYPDNRLLLVFCVTIYVFLTACLNVFSALYEGDAILFTKPPRIGAGTFGLKVVSKLPRFSDKYNLQFFERSPGVRKLGGFSNSVTNYFNEDGYLVEAAFKPVVERILEDYEKEMKEDLSEPKKKR